MSEPIITQTLREFTVQIRPAGTNAVVGTGIAVSMDGMVLTCAHVVKAAGVDPRTINGKEVGVYFQFARGGEEQQYHAKVSRFFTQSDDDIILLQLDRPAPLAPEQLPKLGAATFSVGHKFKSFGYRKLSNYQGLPATGEIIDYTAMPGGLVLLREPLMLMSQHIDSGMSGAAVLDVERNLVVGLISQTYESATRQKDRDTGFAVDNYVLTFNPFLFKLEEEPYPLRSAPEPKTDEQTKQQVVQVAQATTEQRTSEEKYSWNNAPSVLTEWTGRDDLLKQITDDWNNPQKHVTGLIGFGGEGKSSLARKWVDSLLTGDSLSPFSEKKGKPSSLHSKGAPHGPGIGVDGIFWWGFYENRSVDEFLEAALKYMSGGKIDPRQIQSSSMRAQIIGAMLGAGRYLFVLDGLEVMQHQEGDQYGLLQSNDLRDLLTFFARPDNSSFCLVTSRAPLLDLMDYTTYTHRDVDRLSEEDGRALLQRLGVNGSDAELNNVVSDWDGHALTLSILAAYLAERFNGDIKHLADIPIPTADEPRYERVHRVLRRYDEHLTKDEREFMKLFSAFRTPVHESAFEKVFAPLLYKTVGARYIAPLQKLAKRIFGSKTDSRISNIVNRLVTYRLIRHDVRGKTYTTHPLIRNHYFSLFTKGDPSQEKAAHSQIKDYYLSIAGDTPQYPTLDDLKPLIEVVHHACQAGAYDDACNIHYDRIEKRISFVLMHQIGAYETDLNICAEYFPDKDISKEPLLTSSSDKRWILSMMGFCLMSLGRLREAVPFYERHNKNCFDMQNWRNASIGYNNLTSLHAYLGALEASAEAARQALDLARRAENKQDEMTSLSWQGTATHLIGKIDEAKLAFQESERVEREVEPNKLYLYSYAGVRHADHLRRTGDLDYAGRVTEANLQIVEQHHKIDDISRCNRILGDLDYDTGNHESARAHYESALKIARGISARFVLIEALLARGRFYAKANLSGLKDLTGFDPFPDLNEALGYCVESGYRIYEADVRVALAWAWLASPLPVGEGLGVRAAKAKAEAERALQMSNEMGYHWGKVDAEEVLKRMKDEL